MLILMLSMLRPAFVDTEVKGKGSAKERIIPIAFERTEEKKEAVTSPPAKPPTPRIFQTQKSNQSQR